MLVEALGDHVLPALGVHVDPGDRQAALGAVLLLLVGELEHRVDQVPDDVVNVEGEHPQPDADLRGGETGAVLLAHGVEQVLDQLAQLTVEVHDTVGGRAQHRVAEDADGLDGQTRHPISGSSQASLVWPDDQPAPAWHRAARG